MDFGFDEKTTELRERLLTFMDDEVYPAEAALHAAGGHGVPGEFTRPAVMAELQTKARALGLWNLFLPHDPRGGDQPPRRQQRFRARPSHPAPSP